MYNSVVFSTFTMLCKHHHYLILEHYLIPSFPLPSRKNPRPVSSRSQFSILLNSHVLTEFYWVLFLVVYIMKIIGWIVLFIFPARNYVLLLFVLFQTIGASQILLSKSVSCGHPLLAIGFGSIRFDDVCERYIFCVDGFCMVNCFFHE